MWISDVPALPGTSPVRRAVVVDLERQPDAEARREEPPSGCLRLAPLWSRLAADAPAAAPRPPPVPLSAGRPEAVRRLHRRASHGDTVAFLTLLVALHALCDDGELPCGCSTPCRRRRG